MERPSWVLKEGGEEVTNPRGVDERSRCTESIDPIVHVVPCGCVCCKKLGWGHRKE